MRRRRADGLVLEITAKEPCIEREARGKAMVRKAAAAMGGTDARFALLCRTLFTHDV